MVGNGSGELITPLVPSTQPAGSLQQVMSPTLDYGTAGHGTSVSSVTPNPPIAGTEGGLGLHQVWLREGHLLAQASLGLQNRRECISRCRPPVRVGL